MFEIINLKQATDNLSTLAKWHHDEWSYLNPGESIEQRIVRMQSHLDTNFIPSTFIARDKHLLGSAAIVDHDIETEPQLSPWLASVFVSPEHRRQGIGRQLVQHVMAQATTQGIKQLYLFTPDRQNFYRELGWSVMKQVEYHGHMITVMVTLLAEIKRPIK